MCVLVSKIEMLSSYIFFFSSHPGSLRFECIQTSGLKIYVFVCVCLIISYRPDIFVWAEETKFVSAGHHAKALPASGGAWPGSGHTVTATFLQRSPRPHREGELSAFLPYKHAGFSKSPNLTWTQTFTLIINYPFGNGWHLVYTVLLMGWGNGAHSAIKLLFKQLSNCFYLL